MDGVREAAGRRAAVGEAEGWEGVEGGNEETGHEVLPFSGPVPDSVSSGWDV